MSVTKNCRHLILVFGDQLNHDSAVFDDFDAQQDIVWMAEVDHEASYVPSHKLRLAYFFSCMRHYRDELLDQGKQVIYHELKADARKDSGKTFQELLTQAVRQVKPQRLVAVMPGDHRVLQEVQTVAKEWQIELEMRQDRHFLTTLDEFASWAKGRKQLVLESFYRKIRKERQVLLTKEGKPIGGEWNFDKDNRETFGKQGPGQLPELKTLKPDRITKQVIELVQSRYKNHPGRLDNFTLPVTRKQALAFLDDFIEHRLPRFGQYEDAMWEDEAFLYHSRLSAMLNLKLLNPQECIGLAVDAYENGQAPINSVEGFVRQILGWREYVKGIYWHHMPDYVEMNALEHTGEVPDFFWTGETEMKCIAQSMKHVLDHAYAHHIHRLMVLGLWALLSGVHPRKFHDWHMAMYLDAIDWVSLPNTLGMSQWGDGGIMATKPYCATGQYIQRMGNFCQDCRFNPKKATGEDACPFTTLYWHFLHRHQEKLQSNQRMAFQMRNLQRKSKEELQAILEQAELWLS